MSSTLHDTLQQVKKSKQLLLLPAIFYAGLDYAFLTSEFTRAFTSCIFGVAWVSENNFAIGLCVLLLKYELRQLARIEDADYADYGFRNGSLIEQCELWRSHECSPIYISILCDQSKVCSAHSKK